MPELRNYVRYSDSVEVQQADEDRTIDSIIAAMQRESAITAERYHHGVRASHAKSHGLLKGELRVLDDLPEELRQGLFAEPRTYPVLVRMATVPGELLKDNVSTQKGVSIKVLDVDGPKLPGHEEERTQDFLLDNGNRFPNADAAQFLATIKALETATPAPEVLKRAVSAVARVSNEALNLVGADSATLDFFGHPPRHPVADAYYSQAAIRYGDYIAKIAVFPVSPDQKALEDETVDTSGAPDAFRTQTVKYFSTKGAEFEVRVQLCTDLDAMPVEDASKAWPAEESPYQPVARITLPPQDAYSPGRQAYFDDVLSFHPSHSLAAHRPLGSLMRARLKTYGVLSANRQARNGVEQQEPKSLVEVPE